jgi:hypothetical protein
MGQASTLVVAFTNDSSIVDQHRPYPGVVFDPSVSLSRKIGATFQVANV